MALIDCASRALVLSPTGYFDESGTHSGSPEVSVAGYISTPEQWEASEAEWREALSEFGVEVFHMADFANCAKGYSGWTRPQRRERFLRLAGIIKRHAIASVGMVIPTASYTHIFSSKAKRVTGGAYGLAASTCFLSAADLLRDAFPSARIKYIFERGAIGAGQVSKVFQWNAKSPQQRARLMLSDLQFEGKEFVPLQAADILAYELSRHLARQLGTNPRNPRLWHLKPLSDLRRSWGTMCDDELRKWSSLLDHSEL